ncbi:MAG: MurNAc alpha-1-phosphate uridylyltransferase [Gammaproteobacteria bacterium]|jgi:MurNAc alpha-1-phosphate uridylyltransferase
MKAMILAAGRGERLRPYTDKCPKPLLEVKGLALIEHHLLALKSAAITEVVINVSWLRDQIIQALGDGSRFDMEIHYSVEKVALETAGGIIQAMQCLSDRFIVVNSDVFTDYPFDRLLDIDKPGHLVLIDNPSHNPAGDFTLQDGYAGNEASNRLTFSGIACYQKSFFNDKKTGNRALAPMLREAADQGLLTAEHFHGHWTDVGTLERWQSIQ